MRTSSYFFLTIMMIHLAPSDSIADRKSPKKTNLFQAQEFKLQNPVNPAWLKENLRPRPRVMLTPERLETLRVAVTKDGLVKDYYAWIKRTADDLLNEKPLVREKKGKRLLHVSRQALSRISCLALAARLEPENEKYLQRLNDEILAVSAFEDWNPSHFLDTGEMALAVSIGLDWCHDLLPAETIRVGKDALVKHALEAGMIDTGSGSWQHKHNNWNQVCHGGLSAAAITVAEDHPELASKTLARALENIPYGLEAYQPDGLYPEGVSYWIYGTIYSTFTSELYESAFGTDFGLKESPGFLESAHCSTLMVAPSGMNYDFFDCATHMVPIHHWPLMAWFDLQLDGERYYDQQQFAEALSRVQERGKGVFWMEALPILWLAEAEFKEPLSDLPESWLARGHNPVFIFRKNDDPRGFYFGAKGGQPNLAHGNMDAGSFIYEIDGHRWLVDTGNQNYGALEKVMGDELWSSKQDSSRWSLLTKNNFGHSTVTVNGKHHRVDQAASVRQLDPNNYEINLTEVFGGDVEQATRLITRQGDYGIRIQDTVMPNAATQSVVSSFLTTDKVSLEDDAIILSNGDKVLKIQITSPGNVEKSVVSLDPPPLSYDRQIEGLKRVDVRLPIDEKKEAIEAIFEIAPVS